MTTITLDPRARPTGIAPEVLLAIHIAHAAFARRGKQMYIRSITDGEHQPNSLHYAGRAVDIAINHIEPPMRKDIHEDIRAACGPRYDVILRDQWIHIEYDRAK
ncbi:MAG: hypothetical protein K6U77_12960 [Armatimonadetes bacterium]|nr:hypothetical protein [Armatimonadota bacterium]